MNTNNRLCDKFRKALESMGIPKPIAEKIFIQFMFNAIMDGWVVRNELSHTSHKASEILCSAFFWGDTNQGAKYWKELSSEISQMERCDIGGTEYRLGACTQNIYHRPPLFITENIEHHFNILD